MFNLFLCHVNFFLYISSFHILLMDDWSLLFIFLYWFWFFFFGVEKKIRGLINTWCGKMNAILLI